MNDVLHNPIVCSWNVIPITSNRAKPDATFFNKLGQDIPDLILFFLLFIYLLSVIYTPIIHQSFTYS